MNNELTMLETFSAWSANLSMVCFIVSIGILMVHFIRLMTLRDYKKKYDYINLYEVDVLRYAAFAGITGIVLQVQLLLPTNGIDYLSSVIVRLVVIGMLGVGIGYFVSQFFKIYYPGFMETRLRELRYRPRISPTTGTRMVLLSEMEEDVHLSLGMQAEEEVFSIDYDVWVDENSGYVKIEKYDGHLHAEPCPECDFQTYRDIKEDVVISPTKAEYGELVKHWECSFCGHKARERVRVAKLETEHIHAENIHAIHA